jgi:uncharacterized membrane protein
MEFIAGFVSFLLALTAAVISWMALTVDLISAWPAFNFSFVSLLT